MIYFPKKDNFKEELIYFYKIVKEEELNYMLIYSDYIEGLQYLVDIQKVKTIVMGTRKDDFDNYKVKDQVIDDLVHPSTEPYPDFIRFYPIFYFDYGEIWRLIKFLNYPYLELYDCGYSSIGSKYNTQLNEKLLVDGRYLPGFCLEEYSSEREFRTGEYKP